MHITKMQKKVKGNSKGKGILETGKKPYAPENTAMGKKAQTKPQYC